MKEITQFSGRGEVYSWTVVYDAPGGFEKYVPYVVALVKLKEGPLVTAQLTDVNLNEIEIGMEVEAVTRELYQMGKAGLIIYGNKFRPVLAESELATIAEVIASIMDED